MQKFFTLFAAACVASTAMADIVLTESFDRTPGNLSAGAWADNTENTADWFNASGSAEIQVAEGNLSWEGYAEGTGAMAKLSSSKVNCARNFAPITSGKVYCSALINIAELKSTTYADYFLALSDGNPGSNPNLYARVYTKNNQTDTAVQFYVLKSSETTATNPTETFYDAGQTMLLVMEYEFVEGEMNDVVRLYINPTAETTTADVECIQSHQNASEKEDGANSKADAAQICNVVLRQGSYTPSALCIDELKVATSWNDLFPSVTAISTVSEQQAEAVAYDLNGMVRKGLGAGLQVAGGKLLFVK